MSQLPGKRSVGEQYRPQHSGFGFLENMYGHGDHENGGPQVELDGDEWFSQIHALLLSAANELVGSILIYVFILRYSIYILLNIYFRIWIC